MLSCRVLRGLLPNTAPVDLPSFCLGRSTTTALSWCKKKENIYNLHPEVGSKSGSPTTDHKSEVTQLTCVQSVGGRKLLQADGWRWEEMEKGSNGRWSELDGRVLGTVSVEYHLSSSVGGVGMEWGRWSALGGVGLMKWIRSSQLGEMSWIQYAHTHI